MVRPSFCSVIEAPIFASSSRMTLMRSVSLSRAWATLTMVVAPSAISVAACMADGATTIVNVAHARDKETDRIRVMREELAKMGASITEQKDGLTIQKSALKGTLVNGHDDHRVVMALAC